MIIMIAKSLYNVKHDSNSINSSVHTTFKAHIIVVPKIRLSQNFIMMKSCKFGRKIQISIVGFFPYQKSFRMADEQKMKQYTNIFQKEVLL
jgi:hypothetical protein